MKTKILDRKDPILRKQAVPVADSEFGSTKLKKEIEAMKKALHGEDDGVAIAAPQIGISKRIFVVSGKILTMIRRGVNEEELGEDTMEDEIYINPEISKLSKKRTLLEEGCLSVRWLYGKVMRSDKARVRAYDFDGRPFSVDGSGLLAQIFQHEIDHLDGVLFIDKAEDIEDFPPQREHHAKRKSA